MGHRKTINGWYDRLILAVECSHRRSLNEKYRCICIHGRICCWFAACIIGVHSNEKSICMFGKFICTINFMRPHSTRHGVNSNFSSCTNIGVVCLFPLNQSLSIWAFIQITRNISRSRYGIPNQYLFFLSSQIQFIKCNFLLYVVCVKLKLDF